MAAAAAQEEQIEQVRKATNLRTVIRSDPSVVEIVETATYVVVYQWDEGKESWEKVKQEGPIFLVRRDKSPHHALFLLNRVAVKNLSIPLIPGEMKISESNDETLQIVWRGDRVRRGIWFSEGSQTMQTFKRLVVGVVGEPVKNPASTSAVALPSAASGPSAAKDDLSRLFSGLLDAPAGRSTTLTKTTTTTTTATAITAAAPIPLAHIVPVPIKSPPPRPASTSTSKPPPSLPPSIAFDKPGQTADDLLNSILGVSTPFKAKASASAPVPAPGPPCTNGVALSPVPIQAQLAHVHDNESHHTLPVPQNIDRAITPPPPAFPQDPRLAVRDAIIDLLPPHPSPGQNPSSDEEAKFTFVRDLLHMIHTDPRFVDDLWRAYQGRRLAPG